MSPVKDDYPQRGLKKAFADLFTGPDGVTLAIGRVYSAPMLLSGLALPFVLAWKGQDVDLMGLGAMFGGLGGGVWALIKGTNATEPVGDCDDHRRHGGHGGQG